VRVLLVGLFAAVALAATGVDVSQAVSVSTFNCLKTDGYGSFVIIRAYESLNQPDPNVCSTLANAISAGIPYHDVYIFPCATCGNPSGQISSMYNHLVNCGYNYKGGTFGMVWLDIEGTQYWYSNQTSNQSFFAGLVSECSALGLVCGVYTSSAQWSPIMGSGYTGGKNLPLWYPHWDGSKSFSDFVAFGGWTKPNMKQYLGDQTVCGVGVDTNWY